MGTEWLGVGVGFHSVTLDRFRDLHTEARIGRGFPSGWGLWGGGLGLETFIIRVKQVVLDLITFLNHRKLYLLSISIYFENMQNSSFGFYLIIHLFTVTKILRCLEFAQ